MKPIISYAPSPPLPCPSKQLISYLYSIYEHATYLAIYLLIDIYMVSTFCVHVIIFTTLKCLAKDFVYQIRY
jgi:hypothetical protein